MKRKTRPKTTRKVEKKNDHQNKVKSDCGEDIFRIEIERLILKGEIESAKKYSEEAKGFFASPEVLANLASRFVNLKTSDPFEATQMAVRLYIYSLKIHAEYIMSTNVKSIEAMNNVKANSSKSQSFSKGAQLITGQNGNRKARAISKLRSLLESRAVDNFALTGKPKQQAMKKAAEELASYEKEGFSDLEIQTLKEQYEKKFKKSS
jgi:hypothetical protein